MWIFLWRRNVSSWVALSYSNYRPFLLDFSHCQLKSLKIKNESEDDVRWCWSDGRQTRGIYNNYLQAELPLRWRQSVSSMWLEMWAVVSRSLFTRVTALTLWLLLFLDGCVSHEHARKREHLMDRRDGFSESLRTVLVVRHDLLLQCVIMLEVVKGSCINSPIHFLWWAWNFLVESLNQ